MNNDKKREMSAVELAYHKACYDQMWRTVYPSFADYMATNPTF